MGVADLAHNLRLLKDERGIVVGRACIGLHIPSLHFHTTSDYDFMSGVVTVGGLRSTDLSGVPGIFVGEPTRAARDIAVPVADEQSLKQWACEQVDLMTGFAAEPHLGSEIAQTVRLFAADTKNLPVAQGAAGWVSAEEIASWIDPPDEILLVSHFDIERLESVQLSLHPNVLGISYGMPVVLQSGGRSSGLDWPHRISSRFAEGREWLDTTQGLVVEALAHAWNVPAEHVYEESSRKDSRVVREIGIVAGGRPFETQVQLIRNPKT
jgi:hypothetical protein